MGNSDDQDQPTIIIDFDQLKKELERDEILTDEENEELLEFNQPSAKPKKKAKNIYFFDYKSQYFHNKASDFSNISSSNILNDLKELNHVLTTDPESVIVFYYNDHPKVVNQLSGQIKNKFKKTNTLIIAKGLNPTKAQQHSQSKYGADGYLKEPFDKVQLQNTLGKLIY